MIGIMKESFNNIPSLVVADIDKQDQPLPTVIYCHGFTSAKEHNLTIGYLLAEEGYRVVLPDSDFHGERAHDVSETEFRLSFWKIVLRNIKELGDIKTALDERGLILDDRIGVAGTSMGGITTTAALSQYEWIKVAAVLMGSPKITTFAKTLVTSYQSTTTLPVSDEQIEGLYDALKEVDLSFQPEKLQQRPLMFWHGDRDSVVPFDHSYLFYEEVKEMYSNQEAIQFIKETNRDHKVSRQAILETVNWFVKHL